MPFQPPDRCTALRGGRSRIELGAPRGVRGAQPQPGGDLQREGRAAPGPRPAGDRAAERGGHGAGADRDAPLPRRRPRHGRRAVRGAGHRGGARREERPGLSSPACSARMPGVPIRILSGQAGGGAIRRRACCAAFPTADGILADIGGGSLELVRLDRGARGRVAHAEPGRDPAGRARRRRSGAGARRSPRPIWRGAVAGRGRRTAICTWSAAPGGRWRASTWRRPAIRCRWCTTTRSAARRRAT